VDCDHTRHYDDGAPIIVYKAHAVDADGIEYMVLWDLRVGRAAYMAMEDESDACDWRDYSVTVIGSVADVGPVEITE